MKHWIYTEPVSEHSSEPIYNILSDKAILDSYYDYWCGRMTKVGKADLINPQDCILDWVTVHWAVEATPETLLRIIQNGQ